MSIPSYDQFIEPILRYLATHPDGAAAREAMEAAAGALGVSEADRLVLLPSGQQAVYRNRAGWAHDRLKRAGLSSSPRRGFWALTPQGLALARQFPRLPDEEVTRIATGFLGTRLRPHANAGEPNPRPAPGIAQFASPEDRLGSALQELQEAVAAELLDALARVSPAYFEVVVLDLLLAMGYGASREDLQRTGGSGDSGIDGIISLDKLGLEKVYVQAKRWQSSVGRPEIQAFYGALVGQRARRGVFITTSAFTAQALEFARSVEGVVLVDGARLAALMIEHGVGVSVRALRVPRLDSDYFDEDVR